VEGVPVTAPELANTMVGMDPTSFSALAMVESGHFWFETRRSLILGLISRFFSDAETYLEIGCGNGFVLDAVARSRSWRRVVGTELHPSALGVARNRVPSSTELIQVDARSVPARSEFDLVGAYDVLEHIEQDDAVLCELRETLRPRGGAMITVPQHPWLWSRMDDLGLHQRRYKVGEMESKAAKAGFEILFSTSFNMILLPLTAMNRLSERLRSADSCNYNAELNPPGLANAFLKFLLALEVAGSLHGIRMPVGTSRVVAVRKA
jgi:2-polyprenyl-3-methyl-5-hydroxy-6-metoxy-1,4-benzoquinol methylase